MFTIKELLFLQNVQIFKMPYIKIEDEAETRT